MVLVLDTRFLIAHTFPPSNEDRKRLKVFSSKIAREEILIPSVVAIEFLKLVGLRLGREATEVRIRQWLNTCARIPSFGEEESFLAGRMALSHRDVPLADVMIAAIAKLHKAEIVSDDPHFFELGVRTVWYK
ncbi:MAG: hypothetical protein DRO00_07450 [Thermoproteota archaeon]|nr:MAG: hypothetical protein DRO00_07450 [Candidatus Korarchaeota archaeon]